MALYLLKGIYTIPAKKKKKKKSGPRGGAAAAAAAAGPTRRRQKKRAKKAAKFAVGVRVSAPAFSFGPDWARSAYGQTWRSACVEGIVAVAPQKKGGPVQILWDGDSDPLESAQRHLKCLKKQPVKAAAAVAHSSDDADSSTLSSDDDPDDVRPFNELFEL